MTASAALFLLVGCNRGDNPGPKDGPKPGGVQVVVKKDNGGKTIEAKTASLQKGPTLLPFKEAVILEPAPPGEESPPNKTCTGKNVGKIFETIANDLWDKVVFTNEDGKHLKYHAILKTEMGDIHLDLYDDIAPNHVRNFICLAKTGYFDGMTFYYSLNAKIEDTVAAYIESGCPKGTGENGFGSIGYWLKPEVSEKVTHEEGVIGACLNGDPNTASCRFYIAAAKMPQMDGFFTIFGKVSQGLDVVRTINKRAVYDEKDKQNRVQQPVTIRSVTVHATLE